MDDLETSLEETFVELKIAKNDRNAIKAFLAPLKEKSPVTKFHYMHSIRVALLAKKIARFMHLDEKALFYAGLLHDLGKCQVTLETLGKTGPWDKTDYSEIKVHVTEGYKTLRGRFDLTAGIILWHHRFQKNPYPAKLPKKLHKYSAGTDLLIVEYGRILAIADVFDALHRANSKFGEARLLTGLEIKEKMLELNPDRKSLVADLYNTDILTMYDAKTPCPGP
ncbi:MAG: HD domain-containing protein [bacterium]|nr:HD domain-containing protein [bacterium]